MPDAGHSAWRVALRRAAHQLFDEPVVFRDTFAVRLLGEAGAEALRRTPAAQKRVWSKSLRAFVVARSAYAESCVAAAYGKGTRQYCLLGAGLDTFALRNPWAGLRVFELDQPAVQEWKQELAARAGLSFAGRCEWIAEDLAELVELRDRVDGARVASVAGVVGVVDTTGAAGVSGVVDAAETTGLAGMTGVVDVMETTGVTDFVDTAGVASVVGAAELRGREPQRGRADAGKRGAWPPGTMDPGQPAVFAMLGVAPFVGPATLRAVLERVRRFARGSSIVFDYRLPRVALDEEEQRQHDSLQIRATAKGEPFAEGWTPGAMAHALRGFARVEDLSGAELNARYFAGRQDGLRVRGEAARVVLAVV